MLLSGREDCHMTSAPGTEVNVKLALVRSPPGLSLLATALVSALRSYRGLKLHGCSFALQPGRVLQVLFKRSGPWKITKYLLKVSTLPECARTTGNGFLSSLAKMNSIFIVIHFLRQRIHYKYVKKSCEEVLLSIIRTGRILNFNVWKSTLGKRMMFWFALLLPWRTLWS